MTADSTTEQGSAGLDRLTANELRRFTTLNDAYKARFGFPFILAVKGRTKDEIIASFETRLKHDAEAEFAEALRQIERITLLRLKDRLP
jgi:OHCU decarboxylase